MEKGDVVCCPKFNPKPWDKKTIIWEKKLFIKDRYFSFFHIPLNIKSVITKNCKKIKDAKATPKETIILSDEKTPFYANIYINTKKPIKGVHDVKVSGIFLSRVFEGDYKNMKTWIKEMKEYVKAQKKESKNLYFYYTTCPECAKKYGKNYTVILAEI